MSPLHIMGGVIADGKNPLPNPLPKGEGTRGGVLVPSPPGRGLGRGFFPTSRQNRLSHHHHILHDPLIGKANHPIPLTFQPGGPLGIIFHLLIMRAAIQLDHKLRFVAIEIDDVVADWVLASKLVSIEVVVAEESPEFGFGWGVEVAVGAGVLEDGGIGLGFVGWWHKTLSLTLSQGEREPDSSPTRREETESDVV
ncbi:protein of unknown function [Candidatus Promineifilum breve]|uniref:Uncharacterized protein n=1 Tax=Candidatus Promineifilum breve TaxID=1806508 RepID=A0A160T0V9_9CHLR|nr:protein of unknown function [Candidatus Promineifilum breve]